MVKDNYLFIKGCCVRPKKRVVTLCQSLLTQTSLLAPEDIKPSSSIHLPNSDMVISKLLCRSSSSTIVQHQPPRLEISAICLQDRLDENPKERTALQLNLVLNRAKLRFGFRTAELDGRVRSLKRNTPSSRMNTTPLLLKKADSKLRNYNRRNIETVC